MQALLSHDQNAKHLCSYVFIGYDREDKTIPIQKDILKLKCREITVVSQKNKIGVILLTFNMYLPADANFMQSTFLLFHSSFDLTFCTRHARQTSFFDKQIIHVPNVASE